MSVDEQVFIGKEGQRAVKRLRVNSITPDVRHTFMYDGLSITNKPTQEDLETIKEDVWREYKFRRFEGSGRVGHYDMEDLIIVIRGVRICDGGEQCDLYHSDEKRKTRHVHCLSKAFKTKY